MVPGGDRFTAGAYSPFNLERNMIEALGVVIKGWGTDDLGLG